MASHQSSGVESFLLPVNDMVKRAIARFGGWKGKPPMQVKNLPTIGSRYWGAILVASMCGANTGDFIARNLHLGHARGLVPLAVLFFVILWMERRAKVATEAYYWLAVIVLRTAATNLADLATHDLRIPYVVVG